MCVVLVSKEVWTGGCMCVLCWYLRKCGLVVYVCVVLVSKEVWAGGCRCVLCWYLRKCGLVGVCACCVGI